MNSINTYICICISLICLIDVSDMSLEGHLGPQVPRVPSSAGDAQSLGSLARRPGCCWSSTWARLRRSEALSKHFEAFQIILSLFTSHILSFSFSLCSLYAYVLISYFCIRLRFYCKPSEVIDSLNLEAT